MGDFSNKNFADCGSGSASYGIGLRQDGDMSVAAHLASDEEKAALKEAEDQRSKERQEMAQELDRSFKQAGQAPSASPAVGVGLETPSASPVTGVTYEQAAGRIKGRQEPMTREDKEGAQQVMEARREQARKDFETFRPDGDMNEAEKELEALSHVLAGITDESDWKGIEGERSVPAATHILRKWGQQRKDREMVVLDVERSDEIAMEVMRERDEIAQERDRFREEDAKLIEAINECVKPDEVALVPHGSAATIAMGLIRKWHKTNVEVSEELTETINELLKIVDADSKELEELRDDCLKESYAALENLHRKTAQERDELKDEARDWKITLHTELEIAQDREEQLNEEIRECGDRLGEKTEDLSNTEKKLEHKTTELEKAKEKNKKIGDELHDCERDLWQIGQELISMGLLSAQEGTVVNIARITVTTLATQRPGRKLHVLYLPADDYDVQLIPHITKSWEEHLENEFGPLVIIENNMTLGVLDENEMRRFDNLGEMKTWMQECGVTQKESKDPTVISRTEAEKILMGEDKSTEEETSVAAAVKAAAKDGELISSAAVKAAKAARDRGLGELRAVANQALESVRKVEGKTASVAEIKAAAKDDDLVPIKSFGTFSLADGIPLELCGFLKAVGERVFFTSRLSDFDNHPEGRGEPSFVVETRFLLSKLFAFENSVPAEEEGNLKEERLDSKGCSKCPKGKNVCLECMFIPDVVHESVGELLKRTAKEDRSPYRTEGESARAKLAAILLYPDDTPLEAFKKITAEKIKMEGLPRHELERRCEELGFGTPPKGVGPNDIVEKILLKRATNAGNAELEEKKEQADDAQELQTADDSDTARGTKDGTGHSGGDGKPNVPQSFNPRAG